MSKTKDKYAHGWTDPRAAFDPRMPNLDSYRYEVSYRFVPEGYVVVKRNLVHQDVVEVLASGLTKEAAEGFIKLLKEN